MVPRSLLFLAVAAVTLVNLQMAAAHYCVDNVCFGSTAEGHDDHGGRRFENAAWDTAIVFGTPPQNVTAVQYMKSDPTNVYDFGLCETACGPTLNAQFPQPGFQWRFGIAQSILQQEVAVKIANTQTFSTTDLNGGVPIERNILVSAKYPGNYVSNTVPPLDRSFPFNDTDFVWWGQAGPSGAKQPTATSDSCVIMHNEVNWQPSDRNPGFVTAHLSDAHLTKGAWKSVGCAVKQFGCLCVAVPLCARYNCEQEPEVGDPSLYPKCSAEKETTYDLVKEIVDGKCTCVVHEHRCCTECATGANPYVPMSDPKGRMTPTECRNALAHGTDGQPEHGYNATNPGQNTLACRPLLWGLDAGAVPPITVAVSPINVNA